MAFMLSAASGRQLRPAESDADVDVDADADADAEEDDSVNEVTIEDIRPRPQGSSPVYEYSIEEDYFNKKLQEDIETKKYSRDKEKLVHPEKTMEVTLTTEVESGASGFSVTGGGNEGIFIKQVLKESPASKLFSMREGDQLLSATIFFDNIKYEDALKILQYSEPYKVQFSLKRKLDEKEELEQIHSTTQYKKEKIIQGKEHREYTPEETMQISEKTISEEDQEKLIVKQRVGRTKRPKKDRLSWPKFQSIKSKKILGHRRSHSTSDAYEHTLQDISPTSTDTESQFQQEKIQKKGSQKKLKFPNIGFKMHKTKTDIEDKQRSEIKSLIHPGKDKKQREDISMETPEILTVEYTTSPLEIQAGEIHGSIKADMENGLPIHTKKCPEVEISIRKQKGQKATSKHIEIQQEVPVIKTQIEKTISETPSKQIPQALPRTRKKKQKGSSEQIQIQKPTKIEVQPEGAGLIQREIKDLTPPSSIHVKGLEIGIAKTEQSKTPQDTDSKERQVEEETQISKQQKAKVGVAIPKGKGPESEITLIKLETDIPKTTQKTEEIGIKMEGTKNEVKSDITELMPEDSAWTMQMPSLTMTQKPEMDLKATKADISIPSTEISVKKSQMASKFPPDEDKIIHIQSEVKIIEKDTEGKESKFKMPKLRLPTFTWSTTKDTSAEVADEGQLKTAHMTIPTARAEGDITLKGTDMQAPSLDLDIGQVQVSVSKEEPELSVPKTQAQMKKEDLAVRVPELEASTEITPGKTEGKGIKMHKKKVKLPKMGLPKPDIKAPNVDVTLPTCMVSIPQVDMKQGAVAIEADITEPDEKAPDLGGTTDIKGMQRDSKAKLEGEGEIKAGEKETKGKDSKFKMPKFGMPSFGWSSSKEARVGAADVQVSLTGPQVTLPATSVEGEVSTPVADIQAPDVDVDIGVSPSKEREKGKIKMPGVTLPKVKMPHVQVSLPKAVADVSLPDTQAEMKEGDLAVKVPAAEGSIDMPAGKAEGTGMKIHMPKVKMPSMGFSKPDMKGPKLEMDVTLPKVDVTMPTSEVSLPQADLRAGCMDGDISITAPDVKAPALQGSLDVKMPQIDAEVSSTQIALGSAELDIGGIKEKIKMPKFDKPKFGVSLPQGHVPEGKISLPTVEGDLPQAKVTAEGAVVLLETPEVQVKAKVPDTEAEVSSWKVQMPSLKMPKMPKADLKGPKMDISLPSVDVGQPKVDVEVGGLEVAAGKMEVEGEIKAGEKEAKGKESRFKMPKFGMPSFGWSSSKEARMGAADVEVSLTGPQVTLPASSVEGQVSTPATEIQAPRVDLDIASKEGEKGKMKMPGVTLPKVKMPHVQVSLPKDEADVSIPDTQAEMPSMGFSKPDIKVPKLDTDFTLPKVDVTLPTSEVSFPQVDLKVGPVDSDMTIPMPDVKAPALESSLDVKMPQIDAEAPSAQVAVGGAELDTGGLKGKIKKPKFDKPKFGVSLPKGAVPEGKISLPMVEGDLPQAKVTAEGAVVSLETPEVQVKAEVPDTEPNVSSWKVQKPSLKMPKMPKADLKGQKMEVSLPSVDVSLPKVDVEVGGLEVAAGKMEVKSEFKAGEKEAKGKDSKFKMPKFGMPSFGWSSSKEAQVGAADVEVSLTGPQVTLPAASVEGELSAPAAQIQAPGLYVDIARKEEEKGKMKMPSVMLPKVKMPHMEVSLPKAEADVSLPDTQAEMKGGDLAVKVPAAEGSIEIPAGKAEGTGMKIHMPKFKMPSMGFAKPDIKAPKLDMDVTLPKADVTLPTCKVSLPQGDLKVGPVESDMSLTAPDVKSPALQGSLDLKMPQTDAEAPLAQTALGGAELDTGGLKGKIKKPKLDKPKLGVSLLKGPVPEGKISLPMVEGDLPQAKVTAEGAVVSLETPKVQVKAEMPDTEADDSSWKVQMPSLKMPKMPKADLKGPKMDISLPSVDVSLPKVDVEVGGLEVAAGKMEVEGEIKAGEKEAKGKDSKFKMPKFGMPSFGWSSSKDARVGVADVEVSLTGPQVTLPAASVEGEVSPPVADIQAPGVDLDIGVPASKEGEKGKMKMPSVPHPKVKMPHVQVSVPKAEADVSLPNTQAEMKGGDLAVKVPAAEGSIEIPAGKAEGTGMKIHMPKFKMPSMGFSKPDIRAPKLDVDVPLPKVDVTVPTCEVSLPQEDLKAGSVVGNISIAMPDVKAPALEGRLDLNMSKIDAEATSAEIAVGGAELDTRGLKGKLRMPKFDKPKFGVSLPKGPVPEGKISLPTVEGDLPQAKVIAKGAVVSLETPEVQVKAEVPDTEVDVSSCKVQKPSLKMPKMPKADLKGPKMDVSLPSVDVSLPKVDVEVGGMEVAAGKMEVEGDIKGGEKEAKGKDSKFKMPKFGMPSFGWSSSKETRVGAADVDVSLTGPQVTLLEASVEGEVSAPAAEIQAPGVDLDIASKEGRKGKKKMPSVTLPKVKMPHVQVSLPKAEADVSIPDTKAELKGGDLEVKVPAAEGSIDVPAGKAEGTGMKIHMPKVKMPSMGFSKPDIKAPKLDVDVTLPKVDVTVPTCEVSLPQVDLKAGPVVSDLSITTPDVKAPALEGSLDVKAPQFDAEASSAQIAVGSAELDTGGLKGKIKMPKFDKPKFGVSLPRGPVPEGKISLPTVEGDLPQAKVTAEGAVVSLETPEIQVKAEVPDTEADVSSWKVQMPSLKMPQMPKADFKGPKMDISLTSAEVSLPKVDVEVGGMEVAAGKMEVEGEIKGGEKQGKSKDSKFKMPKFGMPSFGWSSSKEAEMGAADVEVSLTGPQVTLPAASVEGDVSAPVADIQAPGVDLDIGVSVSKEGDKKKMKMPDMTFPKVQMPHMQVSLPKAEVDISQRDTQAETRGRDLAVKVPDAEGSIETPAGKAKGMGMKIHMPKVKMPSMGFSKPDIKAPKLDVDVTLPKVDITLPTCEVSLPQADLKTGTLDGDISITMPDVKAPALEGSRDVKMPQVDAEVPSAQIALGSAELDTGVLTEKIKMPKFDKSRFGVSLPKGPVPEGKISLPMVEGDLPQAIVTAEGAIMSLETPEVQVKTEVPDTEADVSSWKVQMPSLKMPKMPKGEFKDPKMDVSLPKVDVEFGGLKVVAGKMEFEGEIKAGEKEAKDKDSKFKMPKFGMPSFGWSSSKEAPVGQADLEVSLTGPQVTLPASSMEGVVSPPVADIQAPSVDLDIGVSASKEGEKGKMKMPSVTLPKVMMPHVQVSLPKAEVDVSLPDSKAELKGGDLAVKVPAAEGSIDVPAGKPEGTGMKIHLPKVKMPSMGFSKPDIKAPKLDVTVPTCEVSLPQADLKAGPVEADMSITKPGEKAPALEGRLDVKKPQVDAEVPSAQIALGSTELDIGGIKEKIKMPKFHKPKFGVSLPKGAVPEGKISLPMVEGDLPQAKVTAEGAFVSQETPEVQVKAEVPGTEVDISSCKVQKPSLKMPKMPKADLKGPKMDISLPSVDVSLPKVDVEVGGMEVAAGKMEVEGEIKEGEKEGKGKDSKFKIPKFGMPSFGWSSSKETRVGAADVDISLTSPQVTLPAHSVEGEVSVPAAESQAPSVDLDIASKEGKKGIMKMPSVTLPKVMIPHVHVSLPKAEADDSIPDTKAELKGGDLEVKVPAAEGSIDVPAGKAEGTGMKIHMPKVKMPSMGFSKPDIKAPKLDVDVTLPKADVTVPTCEVSLPQVDLKAGPVVSDLSITTPDVKAPALEGSLDVKAPQIDSEVSSSQFALGGAELDTGGLKGRIKMPRFDKPKFGVSLPKEHLPEGKTSLPTVEGDLPQAKMTAEGVVVSLESPEVQVKAEVSDIEADVSSWKVQMPSLKMPKMPKADFKGPKMDVSLPSVDVRLPKVDVEVGGMEVAAGKMEVEGEIIGGEKEGKGKDSKFKIPKFGMPSFGWSSSKEARVGAADVEVSLTGPQVTLPEANVEGEVSTPIADIQAPSVDLDIGMPVSKEGEKTKMKMPDVMLPKVKMPHVQVSLPKAEVDVSLPDSKAELKGGEIAVKVPAAEGSIDMPAGKAEGTGMKIHMPKVKMPSMGFSKPDIKAPKLDVDVTLPKLDVTVPTCEVSLPQADLKAGPVEADMSITKPGVKAPALEGSMDVRKPQVDAEVPSAQIALGSAKMEDGGLMEKIKMPKFDKPKFGVSVPKGPVPEGKISLSVLEGDLPQAKVTAEGAVVSMETPKVQMKAEVPDTEADVSSWKVQKPSLKIPQMPKADFKGPKMDVSLPSVDVRLPKVDVEAGGLEVAAGKMEDEGEIKAGEKEAKGKDSKYKMPKFGMPSFGWPSSKEAEKGAADVEVSLAGPQVTLPASSMEGQASMPAIEIQAPSVDLDIASKEGETGTKKMPSVPLPKVKMPHVQVSLPKEEADVSLSDTQAEMKGGDLAMKVPASEGSIDMPAGKAKGTGMKIHMPKVKMPSMGLSKPDIKAPKLDVDVTLPIVDYTLPTCDISLPEADLKAGPLDGDMSISMPGVKAPALEGSLDVKTAQTDDEVPSAQIALGSGELDTGGLKGRIKMPKFEKPKFGVSLPKEHMKEGKISLPTVEGDLPQAKVKAEGVVVSLETPEVQVTAEVPDTEADVSSRKVQMPSLKMPKMPRADFKGPKMDVSLPSVGVSLPKDDLEVGGIEVAAGKVEFEGEIKGGEKEAKGKDSKLKMPKFVIPSFGWSSSKEAQVGAADVQVSLTGPQVTLPEASMERDVSVPVAEIQAPDVDPDVASREGETGKMKVPSVTLPKVKMPHVQVSLPKAEADVLLPNTKAEMKGGDLAVKVPAAEGSIDMPAGRAESTGMKIHMPKVKMPSMGFSKPDIKAPKINVDITLPKVDITLPSCDVSLPQEDLKAGPLYGDMTITAPDVKAPALEGSLDEKMPQIDAKAPSAQIALGSADLDIGGMKEKIKMPKFDKPKFGVSLPKGHVPEGKISLSTVEGDFPQAKVIAEGAVMSLETPEAQVKAKVPDTEADISSWKVQKPSLKMPQMPEADFKGPKMDVSLPSVDVGLPKVHVEVGGLEVAAGKMEFEGDVKAGEKEAKSKDSKFKMPKFGMPSFGWSSSKEAQVGAANVEVSLTGPQVTLPASSVEGEVSAPAAEIQAPGVDLNIASKEGEKGKMKMPSVMLPKVKMPHVQVSLPKAEADVSLPDTQAELKGGDLEVKVPAAEGSIDMPAGKAEGTGMKIHMPKGKMPSMGFSKPDISTPKLDVDVTLPKVDVTLPTCEVSLPQADVKAGPVVSDISITAAVVKAPALEGSLDVKTRQIDAEVPPAQILLDSAELDTGGLKGKIKMPKFDKPKFGVSLPKGPVAEGKISLPVLERDLPQAKVTAEGAVVSLETSKVQVKAEVPDTKADVSSWKVQMPSLKMPKMPKADLKGPKVDVSLPKVDVEVGGLEVAAGKMEDKGEIKAGEKEAKDKDSKFKMPKFGMPSFGFSSSKEAREGAINVEVSLTGPQVTLPEASVEGELSAPAAEIQAPSVDLDLGVSASKEGEKGKMKMPSVTLPKVQMPHVQVSLPKAKADVSLPDTQAETKGGDLEVKVPAAEGSIDMPAGKAEGMGMKIHMPKVKMPSMGFAKPDIKAPKLDEDVTLPKVDVTLSTSKVSLPQADLRAGPLDGDISITVPDVKAPALEGSLDVKMPQIDAEAPSVQIALGGAELDTGGLKGKIKMPKFDKPKFGVSLPKGHVPEGKFSLPTVEGDLPQDSVTAEGAVVSLETPKVQVKAEVPDTKADVSSWKVQMPSLKMPKMPKADLKGPKVDVSLPKVDVEVGGLEVAAGKMEDKGEIKAGEKEAKDKDSKFKMPKFGMPSFGWSTSKEAQVGAAEVQVSLTGPQVTLPAVSVEGEVSAPAAEIQAPGVDLDIVGKEEEKGKMKIPSVTLPKVQVPHVQVSLSKAEADILLPDTQAETKGGDLAMKVPAAEGSIDMPAGKAEGRGMKIHMPKVKMPSMGFSKPDIKAPKLDVDVTLSKVDVTMPTCEVSLPQAELKVGPVDSDMTFTAPDLKAPALEGSLDVKMPQIDAELPSAQIALGSAELDTGVLTEKIKMPKFDKPKFGVSLPKGHVPEGKISLPMVEGDLPQAKVTAEGAVVSLETPEVQVKAEVPDAEADVSSWKVQMPSLKMPKMPKADLKGPKMDVSLPSVDVSAPKVDVEVGGLEVAAGKMEFEGEIKAGEKEAKGKDSKFKMPKFGMPSFGWSSSKEARVGAADVEVSLTGPQVTLPAASVEGEVSAPAAEIQAPGVDLDIASKEGEKGKMKMPHFRMPKVSLSKISKMPGSHPKLEGEISESKVDPDVIVEGEPFLISSAGSSVDVPDVKGDPGSVNINLPKFRIPSLGFSKLDISSLKSDQESSLPSVDVMLTKYQMSAEVPEITSDTAIGDVTLSLGETQVAATQSSAELKTAKVGADFSVDVTDVNVEVLEGKVKKPKFHKPKIGFSLGQGKVGKTSLSLTETGTETPVAKLAADVTSISVDTPSFDIKSKVSSSEIEVSDMILPMPMLKTPHKPQAEGKAPSVDISLPLDDVKMSEAEMDIHGPDLESKAVKGESEVKLEEKDPEGKESKFKMPKFKLPSFSWSPKKEASVQSDIEGTLEGRILTSPSGETESFEIIQSAPENQGLSVELDSEVSLEKDGEKARMKKPQFIMPKISLPKMKGHKAKIDTDTSGSALETEGDGLLQMSGKGSSGDKAGVGIKMPKVKIPTLEFSKPEIKATRQDLDISSPKTDVAVPTCDVSLQEADLKLRSPDDGIGLSASDIKIPRAKGSVQLKDPETGFAGPSAGIGEGGVEIKVEDLEGKTKMTKVQKPKFGISHSKGKVMEAELGTEVPHLKVRTDITEIAVEAPTLEVKAIIPGAETEAASYKIKMHQMSETEFKAAEVDVRLPSVDVSIPKAELRDSDMAVKPEGEIKPGDADGDEKEGHFKLPKFKLPSFRWSPKKEATVKADSEISLEEHEITVAPGKIDPKLTVIPAEDQGSSVDPDIKVSTGKEEQKSQMKKPQFAMPKISLSKIKVPKSQVNLPKGEADRDDSVQIPDIESSRSESMDEGTQISIKPSKVKIPTLEFSKPEIKPPKTGIDVSSSKADTALPALDGGAYQADLILGSGSEDISLKTDIKLPQKEASIKLKSPESDVEGPSAADAAEAKVEDLAGKIKMPGFQKPKFGISHTKGKGPETEISLPKMEAEVPQLKLTTDITDIAMDTSVPKVKSDVSGEGLEASAEKIKTCPLPAADIKAPKVDISLPSVSDSAAEVATLSPEGKDIKMEGEHETQSGEIQTGEHQGWFKMPKFRMPTFGRSPSKEKRSDTDFEGSLEKAQISVPSVEIQGEISAPENANLLPQVDAEAAAGKTVLESTVKAAQEEMPKLGVSVPKIKSSDVGLSKFEADVSLTAEKSGIDVSFPKPETYADVVKRSADGQKLQVHMPKPAGPQAELTASKISASKTVTLPGYDLTLQEQKAKSECAEVPSAECPIEVKSPDTGVRAAPGEITVDGAQGKSDFVFPKAELDIQGLATPVKTEKGKGEIKSPGKDIQGKESKFKIPKFSVPSFGWSATKETGDVSLPETEIGIAEIQFQKEEGSIDLKGPKTELKEPSARISVDSTDQQREPEINVKIPKLRIPSFTYSALPPEVDVSTSKMTKDAKGAAVDAEAQILEEGSAVPPEILEAVGGTIQRSAASFPPSAELDIKTTQVEMMLPAAEFSIPKAALDSPGSHVESQQTKTEGNVESGCVDIGKHETYSTQIVKESEILPSEIKTATFGFSLLKAKIPESQINLDIAVKQQSYTEYKSAEFKSEVHQVKHSDDSSGAAMERTDTAEHELLDKPRSETGMANVSLPELKSFAVEVQPSSKLEEGPLDKQPEEVTVSPLSEDSDLAEVPEDEKKDTKDQKEKPDSKRSPGRFKFWLPSIGFSSSVDDTSLDSKTEVKKPVPEETQPADTSTSDTDSSKQTEKTGWFRFPKLGFTSPSKKAKMADKEETNLKERKSSGEESPSETPDTFFDAKESLSPKEATTKSGDDETGTSSDVPDSGTIVTSSARTELILLEEERASQQNIPKDETK